jgi:hypothetical protein
MLAGAIVVTAIGLVVVWLLLRRANVDPKTWAKRHDVEDKSED